MQFGISAACRSWISWAKTGFRDKPWGMPQKKPSSSAKWRQHWQTIDPVDYSLATILTHEESMWQLLKDQNLQKARREALQNHAGPWMIHWKYSRANAHLSVLLSHDLWVQVHHYCKIYLFHVISCDFARYRECKCDPTDIATHTTNNVITKITDTNKNTILIRIIPQQHICYIFVSKL